MTSHIQAFLNTFVHPFKFKNSKIQRETVKYIQYRILWLIYDLFSNVNFLKWLIMFCITSLRFATLILFLSLDVRRLLKPSSPSFSYLPHNDTDSTCHKLLNKHALYQHIAYFTIILPELCKQTNQSVLKMPESLDMMAPAANQYLNAWKLFKKRLIWMKNIYLSRRLSSL